jgi:hypothetical protein
MRLASVFALALIVLPTLAHAQAVGRKNSVQGGNARRFWRRAPLALVGWALEDSKAPIMPPDAFSGLLPPDVC